MYDNINILLNQSTPKQVELEADLNKLKMTTVHVIMVLTKDQLLNILL